MASVVFTTFTVLTYLWIIAMVIAGAMPKTELLILFTVPLAYRAIRGLFGYQNVGELMPAMASNVMTVLGIPLMMGIGYVLAALFPVLR